MNQKENTKVSIFSPLQHATFRNMWLSNTVTNAGSLIQSVAAAWVMTSISTADHVALVQTATFLPMALFALPAGAIADIYDRRKVQIVFFFVSMLAAILMTAVSAFDLITPWVLLGLCFLVGTGGALAAPARGASVAEQVPSKLIPQAVALNNISYNLARSVGPAVGGMLVAAFGATIAFAVNALSFIPMLESLRRWKREPESSRLPPEGLLRSVNSGVRYVINMQPVRRAVGRAFFVCLVGAALPSLMPLVAKDILVGDASTFGLMLGCFGVGAVGGIFVLQPMRDRFGNEGTLQFCCLVIGLTTALLSICTNQWLAFVVLTLAGLAWMMVTTIISVMVQLFVPRWVMGRAIATSSAAITLGVAIGSWCWGLAARDFGLVLALQIAGGAMLVTQVLGWILPIADRDESTELDEEILADPDVQLGITGRSGPVSIELQYRIPVEKARDFYNIMREQQRARSRNGAYQWSISRNIADPEQWSERFSCPTWNDYLRLRNRRTLEDSELHRRAAQMQIGMEPIRVLRWLDRPAGSVRLSDSVPDRGDEALNVQGQGNTA
ncbi:MFS family permease [Litorivivens lipolytica]|uniref:MFS family permease n=1 Tax=Litorivivens lipolytica TaxID=1524264 RepID=A0A7W4W5H1_9GAMM|nr:MFS transporter [Litorivivens lipolytica]MBB3047715.1 MFS family permease [Litorivivens lipolytica]